MKAQSLGKGSLITTSDSSFCSIDAETATTTSSSRCSSNTTDYSLLGHEKCLLDKDVELERVLQMQNQLRDCKMPDPQMMIRHLRAEKVGTKPDFHTLAHTLDRAMSPRPYNPFATLWNGVNPLVSTNYSKATVHTITTLTNF